MVRTANFQLRSFSTTFAPLFMQVHYNIDQLPAFRNAVVTIGTFDGVHSGHRQVLHQLKEEAIKINGETVIITFHPHPRKIVKSGQSPVLLINTIEEKIRLLESTGIEHLVIVPFTEDFSQLSARQYIESFLLNKFHPHTIIIGYDHHFGLGRTGNYRLLEEYSKKGLFILKEIPEYLIQQNIVSSTAIRKAIQEGKITVANELLNYPFFFDGKIVEGNKVGRTLGYPTANLHIENEEKLLPGNGVYTVLLKIREQNIAINESPTGSIFHPHTESLKGMMNIGMRPTIDGSKKTIEVHIFNFTGDIYGKTLEVTVKTFLRMEQKFNGLESLKIQLDEDKKNSLHILSKL